MRVIVKNVHPELAVLGIQEGDVVSGTYDKDNGGVYFTVSHSRMSIECVIYPEDYVVVPEDGGCEPAPELVEV